MKRGRSTGEPTKREAERIVACKEGPCCACHVWEQKTGRSIHGGNDFHHMKSGNLRRGHRFGIGLCAWHHRMVPLDGYRTTEMSAYYGPSLMEGGKAFRQAYGTDEELLALQDQLIGWTDE